MITPRIILCTITSGVAWIGFLGCTSTTYTPPPEAIPLTEAEWKTLPPAQKYHAESYERLKLGEPKLNDPKEWSRFERTVILPGRKADGVAPGR